MFSKEHVLLLSDSSSPFATNLFSFRSNGTNEDLRDVTMIFFLFYCISSEKISFLNVRINPRKGREHDLHERNDLFEIEEKERERAEEAQREKCAKVKSRSETRRHLSAIRLFPFLFSPHGSIADLSPELEASVFRRAYTESISLSFKSRR